MLIKNREITRAAAGYGANTLAMLLALVIPWVGVSAGWHPKSAVRLAARIALAVLLAGWWATFSITGWVAWGNGWSSLDRLRWADKRRHNAVVPECKNACASGGIRLCSSEQHESLLVKRSCNGRDLK